MNDYYIAKIEVDSKELNMIITSLKATRSIHNNDLERLDELIERLEDIRDTDEDEDELFDDEL